MYAMYSPSVCVRSVSKSVFDVYGCACACGGGGERCGIVSVCTYCKLFQIHTAAIEIASPI